MKPLYLMTLLSIFGINVHATEINKTVVGDVDLDRYLGKWYEIARYENKFQKGMDYVTAEYSFREDGKIKVINSGVKSNGEPNVAKGKAKCPDPKEPGKLKVSFFLWFYGDYYIYELEQENYSYALIGSSNEDFLWILSRTPQLDKDVLNGILKKAEQRGYDLKKLRYTKQ